MVLMQGDGARLDTPYGDRFKCLMSDAIQLELGPRDAATREDQAGRSPQRHGRTKPAREPPLSARGPQGKPVKEEAQTHKEAQVEANEEGHPRPPVCSAPNPVPPPVTTPRQLRPS